MRVAVWHDLPSGGGKRALHDHVAGLLELGHEIKAWCPPTADREFLPLGQLVTECVVPMARHDDGAPKRWLNRLSKGATGIFARLQAIDAHARACVGAMEDWGCDVVLAASSQNVAVSPIGRYATRPVVLYLQEPSRPVYEALPRLPWAALPRGFGPVQMAKRLRDTSVTRALRVFVREELTSLQAYDRVLANSYFSRESILRAYGVEARVCYLGVDTVHFEDRRLQRRQLVVGIGAFSPHKRVDVVIEAVAALPAPRPALTWIGNVAEAEYLRSLNALAARHAVSFTPLVSVPDAQIVDILNEAAVMAYAPRLEPFGYAPLEAGACGVPVVAKAEGGIRESVVDGETGLLVDNDAGLAPALASVLTNPALARRLGAAARQRMESLWSLPSAVKRLESHLRDVVGGEVPEETR
jgi:glycosyltransferase involved in cell wall biosynthesis